MFTWVYNRCDLCLPCCYQVFCSNPSTQKYNNRMYLRRIWNEAELNFFLAWTPLSSCFPGRPFFFSCFVLWWVPSLRGLAGVFSLHFLLWVSKSTRDTYLLFSTGPCCFALSLRPAVLRYPEAGVNVCSRCVVAFLMPPRASDPNGTHLL